VQRAEKDGGDGGAAAAPVGLRGMAEPMKVVGEPVAIPGDFGELRAQ
jgi:hypothetical protein